MGLLRNIFGNSAQSSEHNQQLINWIINAILTVEKASVPLGINSCTIQVIYGNNLQISIQEWYDNIIANHGRQHGLDKYFNLVPIEGYSGMYASVTTQHVTGSAENFMRALISELGQKGISGYQYNKQHSTLSKSYR